MILSQFVFALFCSSPCWDTNPKKIFRCFFNRVSTCKPANLWKVSVVLSQVNLGGSVQQRNQSQLRKEERLNKYMEFKGWKFLFLIVWGFGYAQSWATMERFFGRNSDGTKVIYCQASRKNYKYGNRLSNRWRSEKQFFDS